MSQINNPAGSINAPRVVNGGVSSPTRTPLDHPALRDRQAVISGRVSSMTGEALPPGMNPGARR